MPLEDLLRAIRRRPFAPFRLYVSDGSAYEVRHPDLVMAGTRSVIVGLPAPASQEPVFERWVDIDLLHVTRIEPIAPAATSSGDGQGG